ncbi:tripartite tricarboxylate transporter TctB family protein [Thalassoglobus polymorphus]|uniref:Tripartite tricarboxylate transporter TctB family protein n=1 Tax=Thalassoglobus polymorphus TaxID=2527994 RepID=A0A517QPS0_9PLAN|nr:tripartite tricarboxylate transporter TctB family protein [Thalassoglobus polymorphus]QDT33639.1 Tripartite tricarboxylate transporter TctB family protein [Thalassoglobus polymorphus]
MSSDQTENQQSVSTPFGSASFGLFLIVLSGAILYFSTQIETFDFGNHDPGPKAIPVATGIILLLGGIAQIFTAVFKENLLQQFSNKTEAHAETEGTSQKRIAMTLCAFVFYVISLSYVGFIVSTTLFLLVLLKLFGSRWGETIISAGAIVLFVYVLFQLVFQVSLPAGSLF